MIDSDNKQLLEDTLAFVLITHYRADIDDSRKFKLIVETLSHDFGGILDGDEFFSPRVSGYAKYAEQLPSFMGA